MLHMCQLFKSCMFKSFGEKKTLSIVLRTGVYKFSTYTFKFFNEIGNAHLTTPFLGFLKKNELVILYFYDKIDLINI